MRQLPRAILFWAALVAAAALPAHAGGGVDVSSHPWIGTAAPDISLKQLDGATLSLEKLKGKYVVIHFGASW